jgi:glycosyltransferase involved in cell wall biosynthesis
MTSPHISILLPVKNEERFLLAALDSLYAQTMTSWELVCVDDGSTDGTPAILAEAVRRDGRVRWVKSAGNGLVAASTVAWRRTGLLSWHEWMLTTSVIRAPELQWDMMKLTAAVWCLWFTFPRHQVHMGIWHTRLRIAQLPFGRYGDLFIESPFAHRHNVQKGC